MPSSFFSSSQLKRLYITKKLSTYSIANKYHCDPKTVFYWLQKYQIPTRQRRFVIIDKDVLTKMYKSGLTLKNIGLRHNITASAVYRK